MNVLIFGTNCPPTIITQPTGLKKMMKETTTLIRHIRLISKSVRSITTFLSSNKNVAHYINSKGKYRVITYTTCLTTHCRWIPNALKCNALEQYKGVFMRGRKRQASLDLLRTIPCFQVHILLDERLTLKSMSIWYPISRTLPALPRHARQS